MNILSTNHKQASLKIIVIPDMMPQAKPNNMNNKNLSLNLRLIINYKIFIIKSKIKK